MRDRGPPEELNLFGPEEEQQTHRIVSAKIAGAAPVGTANLFQQSDVRIQRSDFLRLAN